MSSPSHSRSLAPAVLGWVALATIAPAQDRATVDIARLPPSDVPYVELATLEVNVENTSRGVMRADEDTGIWQISALLISTRFEEQWAYVPAIETWIEVGRNEVTADSDAQVETDVDYVEKLVGFFGRVQLYHPHPAGYYSDGSWQQRLFPVEFPAYRLASSDLRPIGLALPSPTDVAASIELSQVLLTKHPKATVTHSVVTPHGLVTYGPTALGLKRMLLEWGSPRASVARSVISITAVRRAVFNIARTIDVLENPMIAEVIEDLCTQGSDENYVINFTPRSHVRHALLP
jgi:hypothetical protein